MGNKITAIIIILIIFLLGVVGFLFLYKIPNNNVISNVTVGDLMNKFNELTNGYTGREAECYDLLKNSDWRRPEHSCITEHSCGIYTHLGWSAYNEQNDVCLLAYALIHTPGVEEYFYIVDIFKKEMFWSTDPEYYFGPISDDPNQAWLDKLEALKHTAAVNEVKVEIDCLSLPHSSLIKYCEVTFEMEKGNYRACESLEVIPDEYKPYFYGDINERDERLAHTRGRFGGHPFTDQGLVFVRNLCYGAIPALLDESIGGQFDKIDSKNDIDTIKNICESFKNDDLNNLCYYLSFRYQIYGGLKVNRNPDLSICTFINNNSVLANDCLNYLKNSGINSKINTGAELDEPDIELVEPSKICIDTDGGHNKEIKGTCTSVDGIKYTDGCWKTDFDEGVSEFICRVPSGECGLDRSSSTSCPNGCKDGACIK